MGPKRPLCSGAEAPRCSLSLFICVIGWRGWRWWPGQQGQGYQTRKAFLSGRRGPAAVNPSHRLHPPNYKWKAGCVVKDRKGVSVQRGQRGSVRLLTGRTTEGLCKTPKVTIKHAIKLCWTFAGRNKPTCAQQWASLMTTGYFVELWTQLNYCLIKEHGS